MKLFYDYKTYSIYFVIFYKFMLPIGDKAPIIYGNWGIYIWPKLALLLFSYVMIYRYLYSFFWNSVNSIIFTIFNKVCHILNNFNVDINFLAKYLENFILFSEFICYHYFLYFLYIM